MNRDRWLGIELRHFAALEAIARERSFRAAASRLGYVQSAISRQIAFLEQMTGMRLIERSQGPRPLRLTEAGELLLAHADDILASIEAAKSDLGDLAVGRTSEVRVGIFPGVPARILAQALRAFDTRCPGVSVTAAEAATEDPLLTMLQDGALDLAFTRLPARSGPFSERELLRVPWVLLVPADSDLAQRSDPPKVTDISGLPLVLMASQGEVGAIEARLTAHAGPLQVVFRTDMADTARALVAAGVGCAILPRLVVDERDARTTMVELGDLLPPMTVGIAWHRRRRLSASVKAFRDVVIEACALPPGGRRFTRGDDAHVSPRH